MARNDAKMQKGGYMVFSRAAVRALAAGAAIVAAASAGAASAAERSQRFDIPAQAAADALNDWARQASTQIVFAYDDVQGRRTPAVRGDFTPRAALQQLIAPLGLRVSSDRSGRVTLRTARSAVVYQPEQGGARPAAGPDASGLAPQAEDRPQEEAGDIIVTAGRREQKLIDVPMSVSAMQQSELDRRGVESLLDLARVVPGLVVSEQGPGQNRIFLRGIANPNSLTSLVGVYLDEIPVTGASLGQLDLQLVDLERVEVLRGPQGTLYGQGSAGGTVRFITRQPDLTEYSGAVDVTGYATRHGDFSAKLTGHVNLALVPDVFGIRISGTFADLGGWIDQPAAGREDINDQAIRNLRVKSLWKPADGLSVETTVVVHRNRGDGVTVGADANYDVAYPDGDPLAQQGFFDRYTIYNATIGYEFGGVKLMSSTSHIRTDRYAAGGSQRLPGFESFIKDAFQTKSFTQELRLSSAGTRRLNWVVGAFFTDETVDRQLLLDLYSGGEKGEAAIIATDKSKTISIFGDASYALADGFDFGVGLRYFHDRRRSISDPLVLSGTFESVNPRVYLSYDVAPGVKAYANVAKGFRSGGFLGDEDASTFDPEKVWSYEVGTKGAHGPFRWDVAAFYSRYKGYQAFALVSDVFGGLVNAGDADIYGADVTLAIEPVSNLTLEVNANVTDTELVKLDPNSTSNALGDRLDFVPDYTLAASAEYRFDWGADLPGFARLDYSRIGKSTFTERSVGLIMVPTPTLDLLNARIGLRHGRWEAELFGENLLNENGLQDPLAALGMGARPRPRTIGLKLRTSF